MTKFDSDRYRGLPITPTIAKEHVLTLFTGEDWFKKQDAIKKVLEYHASLGGLPPNSNPNGLLKKALTTLRDDDNVVELGVDTIHWRVKPDSSNLQGLNETFKNDSDEDEVTVHPIETHLGDGNEIVYMVFYEHHRTLVDLGRTTFSNEEGEYPNKYPSKIGLTRNNDGLNRINQLFRSQERWHSPFTIGIVYRTDDAKIAENYIHSVLEGFGRKYPVPGEGGTEWFLTDKDEVLTLIDQFEKVRESK